MESIETYLNEQKVNGLKEKTLMSVRSKLMIANSWKALISWKKEDVTKYILHLKDTNHKESYIELNKALLKRFFVWAGKDKFVEGLKIKIPKNKLKATDILTPDDVNKMIECGRDNSDKAFLAIMFESGARIGEILNIKVKDLQETNQGLQILIHGTKTGEDYRACLCVYSAQYIRNHILYPALKTEDSLFGFSYMSAVRIIQDTARKAGITKPVSPHKFRHAQATYMVRKGYQESIIRAKLGWVGESKMIARYQHIDGQDIINATMEKEGGAIHEIPQDLIKPIRIAEPIAIADKTFEISKLSEENQELKARLDEQDRKMELLTAYIKEKGNIPRYNQ